MCMQNLKRRIFFLLFVLSTCTASYAQNVTELSTGWKCLPVSEVKQNGNQLSDPSFNTGSWMPATVPGTVLTTLLNNHKIPDPFYGMNNKYIADVYDKGNEYYTYWFVKDFEETKPQGDGNVFLELRGVNYKCLLFLNGKQITADAHEGMFLRQSYNISSFLNAHGKNRLAIIVYPPTVPGNPNGGQGGDGTIARNVSLQYTAGWDWIQPVRDRNTGIWDKVTLLRTDAIRIKNPHVITLVPGVRIPGCLQQPAYVKTTAEVENASAKTVQGQLSFVIDGQTVTKKITLQPHASAEITLPDVTISHPRLWWPNGYGKQELYDAQFQVSVDGKPISDKNKVTVGIRQLDNEWNSTTMSREVHVNGQRIFIKGGNWIISDAMLRFTNERYDAEVRYHRDMNLNLIRVWGGALVERPEFYAACDKYGLLVFQDLWMSGDCNGRWMDPMKKDDQWTRRKYPDNHALYVASVADQVKLVRNHPSLAIWCGGNEIPPPADMLDILRDSIIGKFDDTRWFIDYSNSSDMSYNTLGDNGDGPYNIQDTKTFWTTKTFPFNSEVGSVGVGDYASLKRFIPAQNLVAPTPADKPDSVWDYHKYIGYRDYPKAYGAVSGAEDFAMKAQLINYDQYRALMEGFSSHMWLWYTGSIIWKTQNPWTALRGQMYDYYLDVNACLYGLRKGAEPLHIMMNPADSVVHLVNNGFTTVHNIMAQALVYDINGKCVDTIQTFAVVGASLSQKMFSIGSALKKADAATGCFAVLKILNDQQEVLDENFYWLPAVDGNYTGLKQMKQAPLNVSVVKRNTQSITIKLKNDNNAVSFFNRIALVNETTEDRILPTFFSDNYISLLPGEEKIITIEHTATAKQPMRICVYGWNTPKQFQIIKEN